MNNNFTLWSQEVINRFNTLVEVWHLTSEQQKMLSEKLSKYQERLAPLKLIGCDVDGAFESVCVDERLAKIEEEIK